MAGDALDHAEGQGVDVGPTIQGQALSLFGRGVASRTDHSAAAEQLSTGSPGKGVSQAEVSDPQAGVLAKEQVGWLDVAVNDALSVGVIQCPAGLEGHRQHLRRGQGATRGEDAPQAAAPKIFGHQVGLAVDSPVVDGHHMGVGQRGHQASFGPEAIHECFITY